jgi:signal transduction histidine kinase
MRADPVVRSEKFNLRTLIDQVLLTARTDASLKEQILESDVIGEIEPETDRQLLLSVVANLTQNAIKYSKKSATILVTANIVGKNVAIEVADGCGGLPSESGGSYFKPFVSGDDKTGLGLGLTIVQRAVLLLNGSITVRDQPGIGCIFKVEIPMRHLPPA